MKIFILFMSLFLFGCASKTLSTNAKYDLGNTPDMTSAQLIQFVEITIKSSTLSDSEKFQFQKQMEVYLQEIGVIRLSNRRVFVAILSKLGAKDQDSKKVLAEFELVAQKLAKDEFQIKLNILKLFETKLKGKVRQEKQMELIQKIFGNPQQVDFKV